MGGDKPIPIAAGRHERTVVVRPCGPCTRITCIRLDPFLKRCRKPETTDVYFDLTEQIKKRFDAEGISIPYPQRDVHVYNHND